jgi:hypothetical protein
VQGGRAAGQPPRTILLHVLHDAPQVQVCIQALNGGDALAAIALLDAHVDLAAALGASGKGVRAAANANVQVALVCHE